jgi:hypothetical protein
VTVFIFDNHADEQSQNGVACLLRELLAVREILSLRGNMRLERADQPVRHRRRWRARQRMEPRVHRGTECCISHGTMNSVGRNSAWDHAPWGG